MGAPLGFLILASSSGHPIFIRFIKQYQAAGGSVAATKGFGVENHVMMLRARFVGEVEEVEPELELARSG